MKTLIWALLLSILGNTIAWFHMNAQFKWDWAKSQWWILLGGIPISYMFFYSTKMFYEYFGSYWSVRIATIIFGLMTCFVLGELPSQRIIVSLILAALILYINIAPTLK